MGKLTAEGQWLEERTIEEVVMVLECLVMEARQQGHLVVVGRWEGVMQMVVG